MPEGIARPGPAFIRPDEDDPHWRRRGACVPMDPEIFFPASPNSRSVEQAKAACAGCRVREKCLEWALAAPEVPRGIWAGLNLEERIALKRQRAA